MISSLDPRDAALQQLAQLLRERSYRFTTVTPATHGRIAARPENRCAKNIEDVLGWSLPFRPEILPSAVWELMQRAQIVERAGELWRATLRLSSLSGQLFWHSAFPTTGADAVFFGPDTYRFALALERWFERESAPVRRAVDIGSGSGPGAILTALAHPNAQVFAVDINPAALRLTRLNAALAGAQVEALESDLLRALPGEFDLIVANPPYLIDPAERAYRHGGGPLGAGLSLQIVRTARERLAPGGTLLLYTGVAMLENHDPFHAAIEAHLADADFDWSYRETDPDVFGEELSGGAYAHCDRIAAVVLTATRRSSGA